MAKANEIERAVKAGKRAGKLYERDGSAYADRLEAGLVDGLRADIALLEGVRPATKGKRQASKVATKDERETAEKAVELLALIRQCAASSAATAAQKKTCGVGVELRAGNTSGVLARLSGIIGLASDATVLATLGLTAADIDKVRAFYTALGGADAAQRESMRDSADTTKARDEAIGRVLGAAKRIAAVAGLHFVGTKKARDYEALAKDATLPDPRTKKAKPEKPQAPVIS